MYTLIVEHQDKIKKAIKILEEKLEVKISYSKNNFQISGEEYSEFLCGEIIKATDFGFNVEDALLLKREDFSLQFLNIKDYSKKENLENVRARIIGANGRAKGTIEELTGAIIVVNTNQIGIIVRADHLDSVVQAIILIIHGSKHANVFAYLEKQNVLLRKFNDEDLGLRKIRKK
jgi:ribosomal RNA assembly protein